MIPYIGDFAEDETIYHYFNTFSSNDPAASVTITNLAATDIYVYKDGSVTDLVTDGATVVIDFDSRTGVHKLTIDTSVSADYSIGSDYMVLIEGTTVDAGTVTAAVFTFSIENRYNDVNVVTVSGTAQTANDNGADINAILVDTATTIPASLTTIDNEIATIDANVDAILVDTGTTIPASLTTIDNEIATMDANVDAILVDTATTLQGELDGIQADTEDLQTQIGTAGAGLTNVPYNSAWDAEIQSEVNDALVALGLDHLVNAAVVGADVADNSIMARLVSASATADWDDYVNTTDALQALRDRGDAAWVTGAGGTPPQLLQSTTIATLASQTSFTLTAGSADNDAYNDAIIVITDSATATQKAVGTVSDYVGSTKTVTLSADPAIFTMAVGDTVEVIAALGSGGGGGGATAAEVRAEMDSNSTQLAAIVADTNELQSDDVPGLIATLDAVVDTVKVDTAAILVDTGTTLPASLTTIDNEIATIDANVDAILVDTSTTLQADITAILADTNELQTDDIPATLATLSTQASVDTIDSNVDAILVDTGTTLPGMLTTIDNELATVDGIVDAILTDTGTTIPAQIVSEINAVQADVAALNDISAADVNAQVVDVIRTDTLAELGAVPAATSTLADKINWLFMLARNQLEQTATTATLRADNGATAVATAAVSDDGTTAQRNEFA